MPTPKNNYAQLNRAYKKLVKEHEAAQKSSEEAYQKVCEDREYTYTCLQEAKRTIIGLRTDVRNLLTERELLMDNLRQASEDCASLTEQAVLVPTLREQLQQADNANIESTGYSNGLREAIRIATSG